MAWNIFRIVVGLSAEYMGEVLFLDSDQSLSYSFVIRKDGSYLRSPFCRLSRKDSGWLSFTGSPKIISSPPSGEYPCWARPFTE